MSAGGTFIPPMLIFPRKKMTNILMKGAPAGSIGTCHPSGWIQTHLFTEWFEHFIKETNPTKESPVLLILDGHYSHTRNLDVINIAQNNYVTIMSIPPHTTHKMQPLDRTFMGSFKQYYSEYIRIWQRENGRPVGPYDIAEILGKAYLKCQTGLIAANDFKVTGIYPFDPYVFDDSDFIASTPVEKNLTDSTLSMREVTIPIVKQHQYQQIEENLAQPGCSKDSEVEKSVITPVSSKYVLPIPQIKLRKCTRGRESSQAAVLTDLFFISSYQETLQQSLQSSETKISSNNSTPSKTNAKKRGRKRKQVDVSNVKKEFDDSLFYFTESDLQLAPGESVLAKEDATCIFCDRSFSEDIKRETWIQCIACEMWAHFTCSGAEKDEYVCDYCR